MAYAVLKASPVNSLIAYLVVGLAVGLLGRLLAGRQSMGFIATGLLGAVGGFTGGVLGSFNTPDDQFFAVQLESLIPAVAGAIVMLVAVMMIRSGDARARAQLYPRPYGEGASRKRDWNDGLLASDHRSFETISKQHQRIS